MAKTKEYYLMKILIKSSMEKYKYQLSVDFGKNLPKWNNFHCLFENSDGFNSENDLIEFFEDVEIFYKKHIKGFSGCLICIDCDNVNDHLYVELEQIKIVLKRLSKVEWPLSISSFEQTLDGIKVLHDNDL